MRAILIVFIILWLIGIITSGMPGGWLELLVIIVLLILLMRLIRGPS